MMSMKVAGTTQKRAKEKKRKEPITYYELVELENQRNNPPPPPERIKQLFPIAPDGYIPNSVVKQFFTIYEPEEVPPPVIWKLNWKPTDIVEENASGRTTPETGRVLEYDWTDNEENQEENEEGTEEDENVEDDDAPEKMLSDLVARLREYDWFEISNENMNIPYILRYLFGRLIEREPENHPDICNFVKEINEKYKINQETRDWLILQLEEELDATDDEIIENNLGLIASFGVETYRIDVGLLNIMKINELHKELATNILIQITKTTPEQIDFVLENIKKIYNSKYKKEEGDFLLTKFIEDMETEIAENLEVNNELNDVTKNNEIFKTILKEDWIAASIKESFKSLEDFLEYFLKYLKTAKSKMFYEKVANFLNSLYHEFKLEKSEWEVQIIEHFVSNNTDPKVAEALRLIDLENLDKYYPLLQDIKQKHQVLIELLRSACFEKTRKQVMKTSDRMLRDLTQLDDGYINSLIEFYSSKRFNAVTILSWSETIDFHKNRPDISTEEILEVKELDPSILDTKVEVEVKPTRHEKKKKKHKGKKKKADKADKDNDDDGETKTKKRGKDKGHEKKKSKEKGAAGDMKSVKSQKALDDHKKAAKKQQKANKEAAGLDTGLDTGVETAEETCEETEAGETEFEEDIENQHLMQSEIISENIRGENLLEQLSEEGYASKEKPARNATATAALSLAAEAIDSKKSTTTAEARTDATKKSAEIFIPSPSESLKFYKNRNEKYFKENYRQNELHMDAGIEHNTIPAPKSSIQQINAEFLHQNVNQSRENPTQPRMNDDLTNEYLSGITKRVVFFEGKYKMSETMNDLKQFDVHEKCHLIDQNEINNMSEDNIRFESFKKNRRTREEEYNKLLQCLIIRGLDLHKHYERLMPSNLDKGDTPAHSLQFYNDILVVHPYNLKASSKHRSYAENKRNVYNNLQMSMYMTDQERSQFNQDGSMPNRRPYRTQPLGAGSRTVQKNQTEAQINELELNHIFLINKLLISYGAQNLRKFYATINTELKSYLPRLHNRIPHRIVPLIWNDPVIQKIAMIVSSTKQLQTNEQMRRMADSPGLTELKNKLNVRNLDQRPTSKRLNRTADYPAKYVTAYGLSDQEKVPPLRAVHSNLSFSHNVKKEDQYDYWPLFKQEDSPNNKASKKRLYSHLVSMKNEYIKLQWRYMLQDEKYRKTKAYLPPLSLKATLNQQQPHPHSQ